MLAPTHPCVTAQALSQWMSDRAVLPIENSLGGSIHAVYDLLLRYRWVKPLTVSCSRNTYLVPPSMLVSIPASSCVTLNLGAAGVVQCCDGMLMHPREGQWCLLLCGL